MNKYQVVCWKDIDDEIPKKYPSTDFSSAVKQALNIENNNSGFKIIEIFEENSDRCFNSNGSLLSDRCLLSIDYIIKNAENLRSTHNSSQSQNHYPQR